MSLVLDTNVIVRHLTGEPPDQGLAASHLLRAADALVLTDVIAAETVYVLQSVYKASRPTIAMALRALLALPSVHAEHEAIVLRGLDLYELERMDFTDAYLVAFAEANGLTEIASFDQGIDRAASVSRIDPLSQADGSRR
jgi:predicted nucleic acid-binding protein